MPLSSTSRVFNYVGHKTRICMSLHTSLSRNDALTQTSVTVLQNCSGRVSFLKSISGSMKKIPSILNSTSARVLAQTLCMLSNIKMLLLDSVKQVSHPQSALRKTIVLYIFLHESGLKSVRPQLTTFVKVLVSLFTESFSQLTSK